ncbi:MAG: hypothetical protein H6835_16985 [Planctomycetes bacterium]|nr:hypothetical protein [Planctomycetota bacterium]
MDPALKERVDRAARHLVASGATSVFVFGSVLRDDFSARSDVDMAVEGLPDARFFQAMAEASRIIGLDVDLVALDDDTDIIRSLRQSGGLVRVA